MALLSKLVPALLVVAGTALLCNLIAGTTASGWQSPGPAEAAGATGTDDWWDPCRGTMDWWTA